MIHKWAKYYSKNYFFENPKEIVPFHIFITSSRGVEITLIFQSVSKFLSYKGGDLEKERIVLFGSTCVSAFKINWATSYSELGTEIKWQTRSSLQKQVKVLCYLQFLKNTKFIQIVLNHLINS